MSSSEPKAGTAFRMLIALSAIHCLNDALQALLSASYPLLKADLQLSFAQIGLITLVYQLAASVFQPFIGFYFDKKPAVWSLYTGMIFTMTGLISIAFASDILMVYVSVFLIGLGSSVTHPEAAKLTSLAAGGKRGMAQSLFQVGGNLGGSFGPLLIAFFVSPFGRQYMSCFSLLALLGLIIVIPVSKWHKKTLQLMADKNGKVNQGDQPPFPIGKTVFSIVILSALIFSKYIYMTSLYSYYTFYLIEKFGITIQYSQILLFVFLSATAIGTMIGGSVSDKIGRKYVIWISILGASPFALMMPHANLLWTIILSFCTGFILSSAFPTIIVYAQELLPGKLGLISGLFYGFAFGVAGIASAILGKIADQHGIETIYHLCAYMPLLGLVAWFLPDLKKKRRTRMTKRRR
ncbi:MAG: MFS transporter [Tannerella sp.]|jgi:FSR family fosmidomycin resistance protein-like MFS transporter|nr:MFS transporter [Tannerella sp.]